MRYNGAVRTVACGLLADELHVDVGAATVVTLDGVPDDSVRTERWTFGFEEAPDGVYALTGALRELRCHEGRGHQGFAGEACV